MGIITFHLTSSDSESLLWSKVTVISKLMSRDNNRLTLGDVRRECSQGRGSWIWDLGWVVKWLVVSTFAISPFLLKEFEGKAAGTPQTRVTCISSWKGLHSQNYPKSRLFRCTTSQCVTQQAGESRAICLSFCYLCMEKLWETAFLSKAERLHWLPHFRCPQWFQRQHSQQGEGRRHSPSLRPAQRPAGRAREWPAPFEFLSESSFCPDRHEWKGVK